MPTKWAQEIADPPIEGENEMGREIDARADLEPIDRLTAVRAAHLETTSLAASEALPGEQSVTIGELDAVTGNPKTLLVTESPAADGDYIQRALDCVQVPAVGEALGLAPEQTAEFIPDPVVQETSGGAHAVHLHQLYKGIPVYGAVRSLHFDSDGRLIEVVGQTETVDTDLDVSPQVALEKAVLVAARHLAAPIPDEELGLDAFGEPLQPATVELGDWKPKVLAVFPEKPDLPAVLEPGPFAEPIKASLTWFPLENLRLSWEILLTMGAFEEQYRTVVDARTGEILFCRQLVQSVAARGSVFVRDPLAARETIDFPVPLAEHGLPIPADLPAGFPDTWVTGTGAEGNSVFARLGDDGPTIEGTSVDGTITFSPADASGNDQRILNLFYFNCLMHNYFYLLRFREGDGNFQHDNLGRGGLAGDRVDARVYPGAVQGTASMATPIDGHGPVMRMGLVTSQNRHTALDASVVFHEYTHGVTNRLVGGQMNVWALDAPQSSGMGEGWSDYIACTLLDTTTVGSWVVDRADGIRGFPYDDAFPDTFADLGTGRYVQVHAIGEIWCATLMAMNRTIGTPLGVQLVVDALKLSPSNPSFLEMRDAILAALATHGDLSSAEKDEARRGIWRVFARFGMGPAARTQGAYLRGIVPDFSTPHEETTPDVELALSPNLSIPDLDPVGVASALAVDQAGSIEEIAVSVDIGHPYAGDLRVVLDPPGGDTVVLRHRQGGRARDIVETYRWDKIEALGGLVGQPARGTWTLRTSDLARFDVGTLRRWGIRLKLVGTGGVHLVSRPGLPIPDNDPVGVGDTLTLPGPAGVVAAIRIGLDITHTFIGDLEVELHAPDGARALLLDQTGGGRDNFIGILDSASDNRLAALVGSAAAGDWRLHVSDHAGHDIGKLNEWWLEIERG